MSLEYEPASEPLHIYIPYFFRYNGSRFTSAVGPLLLACLAASSPAAASTPALAAQVFTPYTLHPTPPPPPAPPPSLPRSTQRPAVKNESS